MRAIGGTGTGNGPWITFHDGFIPFGNTSVGGFEGLLNGFDRVSLDSHRYLCFDTQNEWGLQYQASLVRPALSSSPRRPCTLGPAHDARAHPHTALPVLVDQHEHLDQHVRPHDGRRVVPRECVLLSLPLPLSPSSARAGS